MSSFPCGDELRRCRAPEGQSCNANHFAVRALCTEHILGQLSLWLHRSLQHASDVYREADEMTDVQQPTIRESASHDHTVETDLAATPRRSRLAPLLLVPLGARNGTGGRSTFAQKGDLHTGNAHFLQRLVVAVAVFATVFAPVLGADAVRAAAGERTVDGLYAGTGPVAGPGVRQLVVAGRGGVPATGVGAVALNVVVTNPTVAGYVTVWPTGVSQPTASNLNFNAGLTVANMVVVKVGVSGSISMFSSAGTADVIVDVLGWFPTGTGYSGITPARLADTRNGAPTIDGAYAGGTPIGEGATFSVDVTGRGGVPDGGVGAVALNVTVTAPTAASFLTVWPSGAGQPNASSINYVAGQTVANMVIVKVGAGGQVSLFNNTGSADVIVDVLGWFPDDGTFNGLTPARLLDTRAGATTIDGADNGAGPVGEGVTMMLDVTGRGGVPESGVGAVALNVTVTAPTAASFLTVWPAGTNRPNASNLNYVAGKTVANMVVVKVGAGGKIVVFNNTGSADVIVDVLGWFPVGDTYTGVTPARLMDTRGKPTNLPNPPAVAGVPSSMQVIYAVHSGVTPVAGRTEAIAYTASLVQRWFDLQTGGRHPLMVRNGAAVSVATVVLPYTQQQITAMGSATESCTSNCELTPIAARIREQVPSTAGQGLVIVFEGTTSQPTCGYSRRGIYQVLIPIGNCGIVPAATGVFPHAGNSFLMAHEIAHLLGGVPACAPHATSDGHTSDDKRDILYHGNDGRDWDNLMLDPGHDDYYLTGRTDCWDIANSPLLGTG